MSMEANKGLVDEINAAAAWLRGRGIDIVLTIKPNAAFDDFVVDLTLTADTSWETVKSYTGTGITVKAAHDVVTAAKLNASREMDEGTYDETSEEEKNRLRALRPLTPEDFKGINWVLLNTDGTIVQLPDFNWDLNLFMDLIKANMVLHLRSDWVLVGYEKLNMLHYLPWDTELAGYNSRLHAVCDFLKGMNGNVQEIDDYLAEEDQRY
jgi:hypothetical protein